MFESKGLKRSLSVLFFLAGQAVHYVPALAPYGALLDSLGAVLGVAGLGHAAAAGTLFGTPKK